MDQQLAHVFRQVHLTPDPAQILSKQRWCNGPDVGFWSAFIHNRTLTWDVPGSELVSLLRQGGMLLQEGELKPHAAFDLLSLLGPEKAEAYFSAGTCLIVPKNKDDGLFVVIGIQEGCQLKRFNASSNGFRMNILNALLYAWECAIPERQMHARDALCDLGNRQLEAQRTLICDRFDQATFVGEDIYKRVIACRPQYMVLFDDHAGIFEEGRYDSGLQPSPKCAPVSSISVSAAEWERGEEIKGLIAGKKKRSYVLAAWRELLRLGLDQGVYQFPDDSFAVISHVKHLVRGTLHSARLSQQAHS